MAGQLKGVSELLTFKADKKDLEDVVERLKQFVTYTDYHKLLRRMEEYTPVKTFSTFQTLQTNEIKNIKEKLSKVPENTDVEREIENLKQHIHELIEPFCTNEDREKDKAMFLEKFESLTKIMSDADNQAILIKARTEKIEKALPNKVENKVMDEVKEFMYMLPSKEEVLELRSYVRENIKTFKEDNDKFTVGFNT